MNELSKVVNAQLQQAAENLVRNRLMSDEFLDFCAGKYKTAGYADGILQVRNHGSRNEV